MLNHCLEEYKDPELGTRGQQVKKTEAELFELYKDRSWIISLNSLQSGAEPIIQMPPVIPLLPSMQT